MIARLTGGMANQLFMWAFGRSLSLRKNEPVQYHWCRSTWNYALDKFNIKVDLIKPSTASYVYTEPCFNFDPKALEQSSGTYYVGYWQTEKYFYKPDELRKEITLREIKPTVQELARRLREESFTFIHVRRGDYLNPGTAAYHGNLGHASLLEGYYKTAIEYMNEKVRYFNPVIFSDDPEWCKQNLPFPVIAGFEPWEDLYLMSQCRHGIGANSTFSWWGAWLGDYSGRVNIFPKKWFNADVDTRDIIPKRWVRL